MQMAEVCLRRGLEGRDGDLALSLDPHFQGLPAMAHGGVVLAVFDVAVGLRGPRRVSGAYLRRVPLATPLPFRLVRDASGSATCRLSDLAGMTLVEGGVEASHIGDSPAASVDAAGDPLPISSTCFACGVDNPLGLRARLRFDAVAVCATWRPSEAFRAADESLSPIVLTTLLDEAAFWLGALASGESGMTTALDVTLAEHLPFGTVTVIGDRSAVQPRPQDPRYWLTRSVALDEAGRAIATGEITFVAVRGAARQLATWLAAYNSADVIRRVFPTHAP